MTLRELAITLIVSSSLAGCYGSNYTVNETVGGLTGALVGGLLGAQFGSGGGQLVATGAGVLIGNLVGSEIGRSLDQAERSRINQAIVQSHGAPIGVATYWDMPGRRSGGSITPVAHWINDSGRYCRRFRQEITIRGIREIGTGVACRRPSGDWRIVR